MDVDEITARLSRRFGHGIGAWCAMLPERIARLSARWQLATGTVFDTGNSSVAIRCHGPDGPAVLKVSPEPRFVMAQVRVLSGFAPSGRVPSVLANDPDDGALLLEAIQPGAPVADSPHQPSTSDFAELLSALHGVTETPRRYTARSLLDGTAEFIGRARRRLDESTVHGKVLDDDLRVAERIRGRLLAGNTREVLLHGDLHFATCLTAAPVG
jgi:streptomycin 6-kinase